MKASSYSAMETLRHVGRVEIRAQRPTDRNAMEAALRRSGPRTIYRRFFGSKKSFTEQELAFFLDIDFVDQVALVAELDEAGRKMIVGGGRYIVTAPRQAEIAFTVDDPHQGQGIGRLLLRHLVEIARAGGIATFVAEVLPDNAPMLKVFEKCGLPLTTRAEPGVVRATLTLA